MADSICVITYAPEVKESSDGGRTSKKYTSSTIRQNVAKQLGIKFNSEKNGEILEKHLYNATITLAKQKEIPLQKSNSDFQQLYAKIAYEVLNSNSPIKKLIEELKEGQLFWKAARFQSLIRNREAEENLMDQEVEDGIHQCNSCGSKKTKSCSIQTRSADEGMTVFVKCTNPKCGKMWKQYN